MKTEQSMKASGKMEKCMELEHSHGPMETSMKGIGKMGKRMGRERFFIRMEANWKENSKTTVLGTQLFTKNKTNICY